MLTLGAMQVDHQLAKSLIIWTESRIKYPSTFTVITLSATASQNHYPRFFFQLFTNVSQASDKNSPATTTPKVIHYVIFSDEYLI